MMYAEILGNNKKGEYHRISIFLPDSLWWTLSDSQGNYYKEDFKNVYVNLEFSDNTNWDDFIKALYPEWNR